MGDRVRNLHEAVRLLTKDGAVELTARSRLYRTAPWGDSNQDWFVNACIGVQTTLSPRELLSRCQAVESKMDRIRTRHWGPRIIDIDILTFDDLKIEEADLSIPHPLIAERAFVLVPLRDIAPNLRINDSSLDSLLAKHDASQVQLLRE
jgi:2-amino-4-hydroxy-6-hydroxymethyldihydropteridine diphosphokinase